MAKDLIADNINVLTTGESTLQVHARKSLAVEASGNSNIQYYGDPIVTKNISEQTAILKIGKN